MSVPSAASLQKTATLPYISTWISRSGVFLYRPTTGLNHFLKNSFWYLASRVRPMDTSGFNLMTIMFQRTRTLEQGSGKLCTRYLLEQGQWRRRYNSSFDNARTMNCSLNNNTNYDPITKYGFTIQRLQKKVYFTRSICSAIVSCLWKFLQDHKRSPSSTSTTSVH